MTRFLRTSASPLQPGDFDFWASLDGQNIDGLPDSKSVPGLEEKLEGAFKEIRDAWWEIGRDLGSDDSAQYAHTPSCAGNISDFGQMLAWSRIAEEWTGLPQKFVLVCDDPWMFRHLRGLAGVHSGKAPVLWMPEVRLAVRGYLARTKAALEAIFAALAFRRHRSFTVTARPAFLAYGHPKSAPDGYDGYFGSLKKILPQLDRLLHVDADGHRTRMLASAGQAAALGGFGNPFAALTLVASKWRPSGSKRSNWLVRRAAALEGGTGSAAMIRWQIYCQTNWLRMRRPKVVVWPWENHSWERALVRECRKLGIKTLGYQHSVAGGAMLNYSARSNADGLSSLPDKVFCSGEIWRQQLEEWKVPKDRLEIGGAWRISDKPGPVFVPGAPVLLALPFSSSISAELISAARQALKMDDCRRFLVKQHPMTPYQFTNDPRLDRTDLPFDQIKELGGLVFAASTIGLEAALAGLPVIRFQPRSVIAPGFSEGLPIPVASADTLGEALRDLQIPQPLDQTQFFAEVDHIQWRHEIGDED